MRVFRSTFRMHSFRCATVLPFVALFILLIVSKVSAGSLRDAFCIDYANRNKTDSSRYEFQKSYNYCISNSGRLIKQYEDRKLREQREYQDYLESLQRRRRTEHLEYLRRRAAERRSIDSAVQGISEDFR